MLHGSDQDTLEDLPMPSFLLRFFSFILERKNVLCQNAYTSLMIVFAYQNNSITLFLQGQRGF